jgi:hypothetical protein
MKKVRDLLESEKFKFLHGRRNLLVHIISKEGIKVDPNKVEGILKISIPRSKKEV